ncbi:MAG: DNA polymerase III subunit gamma/tau [Verrucomicrobiota bacterium]|nr:DNA polymerase III subunit gamma/tau [Verrucomicrobiota bacterium]
MSYQVIARKYRPQRFSDVVGQEHVTQTLSNAINSGRIAHAYLFSGPRGTGKTTIARIFAKALNATEGPSVDFPEDDERCVEIAEGRALDVLEIDGASNNGVEQVRELRDTAPYAPATCRFKIYIIDEVHMLTTAAFNALLKTLEEPPAHVKFLFATTEPEKVLPTILSRCQRFDLRRIPAAEIVDHLKYIAKEEGVTVEEAALQAIARGADGGMRDAESTLDQLISFCGEEIKETDVLSMFGLSSQGQVISLTNAILKGESAVALRELNELATGGKELARLVGDLLNHFRNLLIYLVSRGDVGILQISEAETTALKEQAGLTDHGAVSRILETLTDCELQLRGVSSKKILVEVSLMKAINAAGAMSLNDVLDKLQEIRGQGGDAVIEEPVSAPKKIPAKSKNLEPKQDLADNKASVEQQSSGVKSKSPVVSDLKLLWVDMMESLGVFSRAYFQEAHLQSVDEGVAKIGFPEAFAPQMELADTKETNKALIEALSKGGQSVRVVSYVIADRPDGWAAMEVGGSSGAEIEKNGDASSKPPEGPVDMEEFKNDPLIKKALEVFKGQIVDVRT